MAIVFLQHIVPGGGGSGPHLWMRKLTFARGWKGHGGTVCAQAVGLLPARMSQRPVALCPGPHRVSCRWHQPPHRAGRHNSYTGLMGMEWGPQSG